MQSIRHNQTAILTNQGLEAKIDSKIQKIQQLRIKFATMYADRLSSVFWLVLGLIAIYGSVKLGIGGAREPGSGFLPLLASLSISLIALLSSCKHSLKRQNPIALFLLYGRAFAGNAPCTFA